MRYLFAVGSLMIFLSPWVLSFRLGSLKVIQGVGNLDLPESTWADCPSLFSDPVSHISICLSCSPLSHCIQTALLFPWSLTESTPSSRRWTNFLVEFGFGLPNIFQYLVLLFPVKIILQSRHILYLKYVIQLYFQCFQDYRDVTW